VLDASVVRELAGWHGDPLVTSLYLDVDGRRYPRPTDYEANLGHLVRLARQRAAAKGVPAAAAVEADLARIQSWLAAGIDRAAARGVAIFSNDRKGLFEPLLLPRPVRDQVSVAATASIGQLIGTLDDRDRSLVVLVDRRGSRLLRLELGGVHEQAGPLDEPPRQVDTDVELGSFERQREEAARQHVRRVAGAVAEELQHWPADRVILGGPVDSVAELRSTLAADVARRVVGTVTVSMSASKADVGREALDVLREVDRLEEAGVVEELRQRAAGGRGGVTGLPATLDALAARRVGTLLISRGFEAPGARCPACGHVGVATRQCPLCGTTADDLDDVVEVAVEEAFAQHATIRFCDGDELAAFGRIGAIERF